MLRIVSTCSGAVSRKIFLVDICMYVYVCIYMCVYIRAYIHELLLFWYGEPEVRERIFDTPCEK
jgi:hypothetical protein